MAEFPSAHYNFETVQDRIGLMKCFMLEMGTSITSPPSVWQIMSNSPCIYTLLNFSGEDYF